ncbi:vWA domain-containing protein [Morganella psychrotolerans]|uniref:vWA domain-containing protein n=1 Tax=Morganella psychrotolerans TaxID=368603 RepID=UPI0039AF8389
MLRLTRPLFASLLFLFSATTFAAVDTKPAPSETTAPADLDLVFVLDKSGSMSGFEQDTIGGYNSVLAENRKKSGNIYVTTVLFNHGSSTLHNREPISKVKNLTPEDYSVGGNTALLDAVGQTIDKTRETRKITKNNNVLFVIITDGEENSSQKYSQSKIKAMIKSAEKEDKWDFIFLGANIDAISEAGNIGIKSSNATGYMQDKKGYDKAYEAVNKAVSVKQQSKPITGEWKAEVEQDNSERSKK